MWEKKKKIRKKKAELFCLLLWSVVGVESGTLGTLRTCRTLRSLIPENPGPWLLVAAAGTATSATCSPSAGGTLWE